MSGALSLDTQAILLLTAPLLAGRGDDSSDALTPGEYRKLARWLRAQQRRPADLLPHDASEVLATSHPVVDPDRVKRLLLRGFLLGQALERWQARAIWVLSRADATYPARFKARLRDDAPPIMYGCGDAGILETGGLAVIGSRDASDDALEYARRVGRIAAAAGHTVISGGARGIDQTAMRGALEEGGTVAGVLADSLERAAMHRENRDALINGRLALISTYDPSAGFNAGHAMQRNKLIYALADAALVVSSDYEKGGTWTGAVEQLDRFRFAPIYVRANGEIGRGLEALRRKGAAPWPDPTTSEQFASALNSALTQQQVPNQPRLDLSAFEE